MLTSSRFGGLLGVLQVPLEISDGGSLPLFVLLNTSDELVRRFDLAIGVFDLGLEGEKSRFLFQV